jgi:hypothetical protein
MKIISNIEFVKLVENQPAMLRRIAAERYKNNPHGKLTMSDLEKIIDIFRFTADRKSISWLQSLVVLAKNGKIARMRRNATNYTDHVEEVNLLHRTGSIQFDLHDHVMCKESGRYGTVIDYIPSTKEFLVILDPFHVRTYKADQLDKVA